MFGRKRQANELRNTIQGFLDLVEASSGSTKDNERALALFLDRLALATHASEPSSSGDSDADAPPRDYHAVRAQVVSRFPQYSFYQSGSLELNDEFLVGDAIADTADVAIDLSEVAWLWDHVGEIEALWQFHFGFTHHWGSHLRSLQWYIHELETAG